MGCWDHIYGTGFYVWCSTTTLMIMSLQKTTLCYHTKILAIPIHMGWFEVKCENKIQACIKIGLNSKMPSRYLVSLHRKRTIICLKEMLSKLKLPDKIWILLWKYMFCKLGFLLLSFIHPRKLEGLECYLCHILIPQSDLRYSQQTNVGVTHFHSGMSYEED